MPTEILHHEGKFVLWTSVCDGPASLVMSEDELRAELYRADMLTDAQVRHLRHPSWGVAAWNDYMIDVEANRAKIERRIARAKLNGASGLRWYDETHDGELWADRDFKHFTRAEIFAELEMVKP